MLGLFVNVITWRPFVIRARKRARDRRGRCPRPTATFTDSAQPLGRRASGGHDRIPPQSEREESAHSARRAAAGVARSYAEDAQRCAGCRGPRAARRNPGMASWTVRCRAKTDHAPFFPSHKSTASRARADPTSSMGEQTRTDPTYRCRCTLRSARRMPPSSARGVRASARHF